MPPAGSSPLHTVHLLLPPQGHSPPTGAHSCPQSPYAPYLAPASVCYPNLPDHFPARPRYPPLTSDRWGLIAQHPCTAWGSGDWPWLPDTHAAAPALCTTGAEWHQSQVTAGVVLNCQTIHTATQCLAELSRTSTMRQQGCQAARAEPRCPTPYRELCHKVLSALIATASSLAIQGSGDGWGSDWGKQGK